ncbi:glucosaminidase domain-containing protein [Candidatus Dojkabacteria bacterium]|nr:glucosaminidase domain-containing protein [Candidatus Dojkabacteria bacterium]
MIKTIKLVIVMLFFSLILNAQKHTPLTFIEKYDSISIKLMEEFEIPSSVMLGISMHESAYGNSKLCKNKNNFFGVKYKDNYRGYDNDTLSFEHFCSFISKKKYYNNLTQNKIIDYKIWITEIGKNYSEDPNWHIKILYYIKKYKLYDFDYKKEKVVI